MLKNTEKNIMSRQLTISSLRHPINITFKTVWNIKTFNKDLTPRKNANNDGDSL